MSYPLQMGTGFFYGSYKITPDIQASLQLNYGYDRSHSSSLTIQQTGGDQDRQRLPQSRRCSRP